MPSQRVVAGFVGGTSSNVAMGPKPLVLTGASVTLAGAPASATLVQPGAQVQGTATASGPGLQVRSLDLRPQLLGSITAVNGSSGTVSLAQRTVVVTALTQLAGRMNGGGTLSLSLADFRPGDAALVFGTQEAGGHILATRVERQASAQASQVIQGAVAGLDASARTFTLGPTLVDYSHAEVEGTLANGVTVLAKGTLSGGVLTASHVEVMAPEASADEGVELRGPIANLDATALTFHLAGFTVDYSHAAVHGGTLANGAVVEVEGLPSTTQPALVLASEVEVEGGPSGPAPSNGETKGLISALDAAALTFRVSGQDFWADAATVIQREDRSITLAQLAVGDWVEVRFDSTKPNAAGAFYAVRVDADESGMEDHELSGTVSAFQPSAQTFVLAGLTVAVTPATQYESEHGGPLTSAAFWGTDRTGARVEAKGTLSGTVFTASLIILKEPDSD